MSEHEIGNVYKDIFEYQDKPEISKERRILLVDILGEKKDIGLITQLTTKGPKSPPAYFDQFKKPIEKWQQAGLDRKSYARVNKNIFMPINVLSKPIGKMDEEEFAKIAREVREYIAKHGMEH